MSSGVLVRPSVFGYMYAVRVPYVNPDSAMPRTIQDPKLDTRAARLRLPHRREPYWRSISEGLAIGYRRGAKGGTWIARHYTPDYGRRFQALGTADDVAN